MKPVGLIFHNLIETFIVAWKCVEFSDKDDLARKDVQIVLKISHPHLLR